MKLLKLGLSALCLGAMALTACSASRSASGDKGTLEQNGFKVTVETRDEYDKKVGKPVPTGEGLQYYLYTSKTENNELVAYASIWYFDTIDNASKFNDAHIAELARLLDVETDKFSLKVGQSNNAVYAASDSVITTLGLTNI